MRAFLGLAALAGSYGCGEPEPAQCPLPDSRSFVQVEAIGDLNVARRADGRIACWGYDTSGACAVDFSGAALYPVMSNDVRCLNSLDVDDGASGGLDAWGYPMLWGNEMGSLFGKDEKVIHPLIGPTPMPLLDLSVDSSGVGVVDLSGRVYWRGDHHLDKIVDEGLDDTMQLIELPDPARRVYARAGGLCALTAKGELWCLGYNFSGKFGLGDNPIPETVAGPVVASPTLVDLPEPIVDLVHRVNLVCALGQSGTVYCAGDVPPPGIALGEQHQFVVIETPPASKVKCADHVCGVISGSDLYFFGDPLIYQVVDGEAPKPDSYPATKVDGAGRVADFAFGEWQLCVVDVEGGVQCRGVTKSGDCYSDSEPGWAQPDFDHINAPCDPNAPH